MVWCNVRAYLKLKQLITIHLWNIYCHWPHFDPCMRKETQKLEYLWMNSNTVFDNFHFDMSSWMKKQGHSMGTVIYGQKNKEWFIELCLIYVVIQLSYLDRHDSFSNLLDLWKCTANLLLTKQLVLSNLSNHFNCLV
jgi:hypothetical protein